MKDKMFAIMDWLESVFGSHLGMFIFIAAFYSVILLPFVVLCHAFGWRGVECTLLTSAIGGTIGTWLGNWIIGNFE